MPGTYQVVLSSFSSGLIDERYADEHCPRNSCDPGLGNVIEIITGLEVIPGVDAVLESGAVIRGQLTDSQSGLPVTDYCVWIYNQLGVYATLACSDANGDFESATGLPDGNYRLSNQLKNPAYQPVNGGYIPQVWTNDGTFLACGAECDFTLGDTFTVNGTDPVEGINLAMQKAEVTLSGTLTNQHGQPLPGVAIDVLNSEGSLIDAAVWTDENGFWSKQVSAFATYYAKSIGEWAPDYQAEIWDDIPCDECDAVAVGTPIVVTDIAVSGIDIELSLLDPAMISGTVTADDGGALLQDINVCVANKADPDFEYCDVTNASGAYAIGGLLKTGDYVVYTRDVGGQAFFREMYDGLPCCDVESGTPVDLSGGNAVIDFGLAASGRIAGFVKDSTTDVGIANVLMLLLDESCATVDVVETYTDAGATLGEYSISGVPDGTYYLMAAGEYQGYINELYPDEKRVNPCVGDFPVGQAIIIENLSEVENVDFALDLGGSISGVISDVNGMLPFNRAQMRLHDADGTLIGVYGSWQTDWTPDVSYIAGGLLPGTYQVILSSSNLGLVDELYDDIPCPRFSCGNGLATEVIVGPAEHVTGIDAVLEPGSTISGNITDKASGLPLPFYSIAFYSDSGAYAGFGFSDVNGDYTTTTGFPAGGYLASNQFNTDPVAQGYLPMVYPNRTCGEPCNFLLGDEIVVDGVNPEFGIDFELETGTAISGVVTTGGGATPLANITLQLRRSTDGAIIRTVVTDGSGAYEFAGVGSGTYFIRTKNTLGYADRLHAGISCNPFCDPLTGTPIGANGFSDITGISFDLPVTPAIAGVVTDAVSTLPVAGVKVQAYDVLGTLIATATSNGAGEYLIQNLYAGNFYVKTANTAGYVDDLWNGMTCLPGCNPTLGTQVPVAATGTVSGIDLDLGSSSKVQGNVSKSAGGALSGVTVQVYSAAGALVGSSITDASGNYSVNGLSEGNYHAVTGNNFGYINKGAGGAVCQPATCVPTSTAVISIVGVNQTLVRDFVLPLGGVVSGTVTNTAAAPLPGVVVRAYNASGTQVGSATSGPAGNYSIAGLAGPVVYLRTTNTAGYQNQRYNGLPCGSTCNVLTGTSVAVSAGVTASGKNFSLALGGSIAGVVKTTSAAPIANVQVQALDALSGVLAGYAVSGPTGAFTVAGLPDGDYRLKTVNSAGYIDRVRGGDHCSPEPCALASGTVTNVASANITGQDITLSLGGAISGVVTTPQEGGLPPIPLPLGTAWIYSETGQLVKQGGIFNGSFFVNGLANGIYHMVVTNGSGLVDQLWEGLPCLSGSCDVTLGAEIVVASAEATFGSSAPLGGVAGGDIGSDQLNFSLDKGYRISGTLKFGTTPIASTKVYFFDAAGKPAGEATTNGLGEFTLDSGLPNGSYFAATSRAARPEDTPDQAADAEDGAVDGLTDEIYDGFACSGVCAPSVDSGIGTPIVIDGADETGIDIVLSAAPGITLEKHTNGVDADTPDGGEAPEIAVGATVNWTYEVTNSGGYDLVNIVVVDNPAVTITCGFSSLAVGESDTCTASGVAQDLSSGGIIGNCSGRPNSHLFQNTATVTAETADVGAVMDEDTSHYCNPDVERPDLIFSDSFEN